MANLPIRLIKASANFESPINQFDLVQTLRTSTKDIINWIPLHCDSVSHLLTINFSSFFAYIIIQIMRARFQPDRAKALGRMLFQKYDLGKRGALGPKQCYEIFSDFCYRILAIQPQPTMEEANSMYEILDDNKDKKVTEADFQNLALKFLCGQPTSNINSSYNFQSSNVSSQVSGNSNKNITTNLQTSTVTTYKETKNTLNITPSKNLTVIARKRIDVARRLFKLFDKDASGFLTEDQIPFIIEETYRQMGQNYKPSRDDVKSYMKMVDTDKDGRISLNEFEEIILRSLKNAGFEIYE